MGTSLRAPTEAVGRPQLRTAELLVRYGTGVVVYREVGDERKGSALQHRGLVF